MLIALLALAAGAAEWVLYEGESVDEVVAAVSPLAGGAELTVSTLADAVRDRAPVLRGQAKLTSCQGDPVSANSLASAIKKADSALLYQDHASARRTASEALQQVACLDGPVDRHALVRLHLLEGLGAFHAGDAAAARASFRAAVEVDPRLDWDEAYGTDAKAILTEVAAKVTSLTPVIVEVIPGGRARIDGESMSGPIEILPGRHLLQVTEGEATRSYALELPETPQVTIVAPAALTAEVTAGVEDEAQRRSLSLALTGVVDRGEQMYLVHGGHIWRGEPYRNQWERLGAFQEPEVEPVDPDLGLIGPLPPDPVPEVPARKRTGLPRGAFTVPMAVVGSGLAVYGFTSAGSSRAQAKQLQTDAHAAVQAGDAPAAMAANDGIASQNTNILLGQTLAGGGVAVALTALYLSVRKGKGSKTVVVPGGIAGRW